VARRLCAADAPRGLSLTHILDRRAALKRPAEPTLASIRWTTSIDEILHGDADVVVEAIGGLDPAAAWIEAALAAGKSVVTANKQVIARHGARLLRVAERRGRELRFEAAVGGAMPIVRAIDGLAGDRVTRIVAILNGTTNAVLSQMEATGCALEHALADARARGLAEADPAADLDGEDARAKLAILCALAFGIRVEPARIAIRSCAAIDQNQFAAARLLGATIRQIARADYDADRATLTAFVEPALVPQSSIFGRATGPANAAVITGAHSGETGIFGIGAGGAASAVAIISDIVAIARATSHFSLLTSHFPEAEAV
jgi:homoserine dehydrogenase